jgi:hypothetical protein
MWADLRKHWGTLELVVALVGSSRQHLNAVATGSQKYLAVTFWLCQLQSSP